LIIFRILLMTKYLFKIKISVKVIFIVTFIVSFIIGHYSASSLSFTLSFLFFGTFIALGKRSRLVLFLGLTASHLLVGLFLGNEISLLAILLSGAVISLFSLVMPLVLFHFFTFKIINLKLIESVLAFFIIFINKLAKLCIGSHFSPSVCIILAIWMLLLKKNHFYFFVLLLFHANVLNAPAHFS
jgi:hypothetical protein